MIFAIIIDILLLGIIGFGIYYGVTKGFVNMAAKPFKTVFAIVIVYTCCSWFAALIVSPIIDGPISGYVSDTLISSLPADVTSATAADELPTILKFVASMSGIDFAEEGMSGVDYIELLSDRISAPIIGFISIIISAVALFFIGKLIFKLAMLLLDKFCNAGLLGKINKVLGVVFGALVFVLIAWSFAVILDLIFNLPVFEDNKLISEFEGFVLYRFFNFISPLALLFSF